MELLGSLSIIYNLLSLIYYVPINKVFLALEQKTYIYTRTMEHIRYNQKENFVCYFIYRLIKYTST